MADFEDYLSDEDFLETYGRAYFDGCIGVVYVEDRSDVNFWSLIIDKKKYEIKIYTRDDGRNYYGKGELEKEYSNVNKSNMIAVDGDFDYICPISDNANQMISSKYILHTFGYGRESVLYNQEFLDEVAKKFIFYQDLEFNIVNLLNSFSELHYSSLVMYLFLRKFDNDRLLSEFGGPDKFHEKLELKDKKYQFLIILDQDNNLIVKEEVLNQVRDKLTLLENELSSLILNNFTEEQLNSFKEELRGRGLVPSSAYRYINSHILEEWVILPILRNIKECQKCKEINSISGTQEIDANTVKSRKQQIQKHFDVKCGVDTIVNSESLTKSHYVNDELFKKICQKYHTASV